MLQDGWEVLTDFERLSAKATRMVRAMLAEAPPKTVACSRYIGRRRGLMLYGPGSPEKLPMVRRHLKAGGRVAMWDMGYWERRDAMRLSIDGLHPTAEQLALAPPGPGRRSFDLREDADSAGPILLVGLGPKSVFAYGLGHLHAWERAKVADLRLRYPGREIVWRPKGRQPLPLMDLPLRHGMPIEDALRGCSLVVCKHSNVAVDACVAGVPVECEGGAALALYGETPAPTREQRAELLRRLSWWEWSRFETEAAWRWIKRVTST